MIWRYIAGCIAKHNGELEGEQNLQEQLQQIEHSAIPSSKHLNLTRVTVYFLISNTFSHQKFRNSWNSIPFLNVSHCASRQLHVFHFCPKWAYGTRIGNLGGISNKISMVFPAFLFPVPHCVSSKIHARRYDKCHPQSHKKRKTTLFYLSVGHMACKVERKRFETPCSKWRSSSSASSSYNNNNNNQIPASLYNLHQATICCLPFLHPTVSLYQVSLNNTRGHLSFLQDHLCEHWHVFHWHDHPAMLWQQPPPRRWSNSVKPNQRPMKWHLLWAGDPYQAVAHLLSINNNRSFFTQKHLNQSFQAMFPMFPVFQKKNSFGEHRSCI